MDMIDRPTLLLNLMMTLLMPMMMIIIGTFIIILIMIIMIIRDSGHQGRGSQRQWKRARENKSSPDQGPRSCLLLHALQRYDDDAGDALGECDDDDDCGPYG